MSWSIEELILSGLRAREVKLDFEAMLLFEGDIGREPNRTGSILCTACTSMRVSRRPRLRVRGPLCTQRFEKLATVSWCLWWYKRYALCHSRRGTQPVGDSFVWSTVQQSNTTLTIARTAHALGIKSLYIVVVILDLCILRSRLFVVVVNTSEKGEQHPAS